MNEIFLLLLVVSLGVMLVLSTSTFTLASNISGSNSSGTSGGGSIGVTGGTGGGTSSVNNNNPGSSTNQGSTTHCDKPGYPSCSSLGSQAGKSAPGTSCPPGHSKAFCSAYNAAASSSQQVSTTHCDRSGYPSCYSLGYADGRNHPGTSCPGGHSATFCSGWNSGAGIMAHCDQPGWPSCYSVGYNAGRNAPGTSCPPGHSQAFCNGYEYASGGSGTGYTQGVADPTHCDQPGSPACYDAGYHDGYNNAVNEHHQFHTSCPLGHSKAFCTGYVPGYTRGISYNLGFSQGVNAADHDWTSSNQDIHAFTYDCPTGHTKDFCNGYTDGYGDEVNDILG